MKPSNITEDAYKILETLYAEYVRRRNDGTSKDDAAGFPSARKIQSLFFADVSLADVEDFLQELARNGFLRNENGDDTIMSCQLLDKAIVLFEQDAPDQGERQTNAIEAIATTAKDLAESAKLQSDAAKEEVELFRQQLELANKNAAAAKKDSLFSKIVSIIAIIISILAIIIPRIS